MNDVKKHYDDFLSGHYSWICGGFDEKLEKTRAFFSEHGISANNTGIAFDLGSGPGFQSIVLAERGFKVTAIDFCKNFLNELELKRKGLPIAIIEDNILQFEKHCVEKMEVCVCMGDVLIHLPQLDEVESLFKTIYRNMQTGGAFIATFRDLMFELDDTQRFIPVRSDDNKIFTCILEYEKEHVLVNDLVYLKNNGKWQMTKSHYRKLRIPQNWAVEKLTETGFAVKKSENVNGWITIIAGKM